MTLDDYNTTNIPTQPSRFFYPTLDKIPSEIAKILTEYSHIPAEQHNAHILAVRNQAYKSRAYPCLGRFRFLDLDITSTPIYESDVLPLLKSSPSSAANQDESHEPIFLDVGTCLGQDIRKLIFDGVPPSRLYGSDIDPTFIEAGYALFRDENKFPRDHFLVPGDLLTPTSTTDNNDQLKRLDGKVDILHITAVFHLFGLEDQKTIARRCLRLLRKDGKGRKLVFGGQAGNISGTETVSEAIGRGNMRMRHNPQTWREMWEGIVREDEWKDIVKGLEVDGEMQEVERYQSAKSDVTVSSTQPQGGGENAGKSKVIGNAEEGFRWQTFWIWIQF